MRNIVNNIRNIRYRKKVQKFACENFDLRKIKEKLEKYTYFLICKWPEVRCYFRRHSN